MVYFSDQHAFSAVDGLVKSWDTGGYKYHIKFLKRGSEGADFVVVFSTPAMDMPMPQTTTSVSVNVKPPDDASGGLPRMTYSLESQRSLINSTEPFQLAWIDRMLMRKRAIGQLQDFFMQTGSLGDAPRAFVPGEYAAALAMQEAKIGRAHV